MARTPAEIMADINAAQVELAKAQQPILATLIDTLKAEPLQTALASIKDAADQLGQTSTIPVQAANLIVMFGNLSNAVAQQANTIAATARNGTASDDKAEE